MINDRIDDRIPDPTKPLFGIAVDASLRGHGPEQYKPRHPIDDRVRERVLPGDRLERCPCRRCRGKR